jgi:filamentous hemagglutinin family protein
MSSDRITAAGVGVRRRSARSAWLGGVSVVALLFASNQSEGRDLNSIGAAIASTAAAAQAAAAAAQQGAAAAAQAQASLARAAAALAAARLAQQAAAAAGSSSVPNGLTIGGLVPSGGTASNVLAGIEADLATTTPTLWRGASLPMQTVSGSSVTVDITQNQPKAILNWNTFNVGTNTTLNFHQSASDWIALNRVTDPLMAPSQILGHVNALGSIYVINRNGIIFGAGAQINVQSLIASTLDVGNLTYNQAARDNYFLSTGIGNPSSFSLFDPVGGQTSSLIPGNVTVEAGASITANIRTDVVPLGSPGFIYMFGANVYNFGTLTAPQGEVALAASRAVTLTPGKDQAANFPTNVLPSGVTFRGTGLQLQSYGTFTLNSSTGIVSEAPTKYFRDDVNHIVTGEVTNGGVIDTRQGIALLAGDRVAVTVAGVISADTSISRNSMVLMHAATSVEMNGVISMQPYDDGSTLPILSGAASNGTASNVQSYMPPYVEMSAQHSVTVGASGLVSAPSAAVSLNAVALGGVGLTRQLFNGDGRSLTSSSPQEVQSSLDGPQQVLLSGSGADGPGATIDVAGLQNVVLPATYNFISFTPRAEFADMPLQRPPFASVGSDGKGVVYGQTLWIDIRASGTRSDGTTWVGTPLADASGVVGAVGRSINQLMTSGGTVSLTTDVGGGTLNQQVVANSGSVINVAGGQITFLPGVVSTTRLLGIDGRIYSMANADPNMTYVGIAGQFSVNHSRWGVTENWSTATPMDAPGYTEGHDAGGVTITTVTPQLNLGGTMYFGSVAGQRQIALGNAPSDTTDSTSGTAVPRPTPLQAKADQLPSQGYLSITTPTNVQIGTTPSLKFNAQDPLTQLSADTLSGYGLSALTIKAYDLVVSSGSTLRLAPGGLFSASIAGAIDIAGTITAPSGTINLLTDRYNLNPLVSNAPKLQAPTDPATGAVIAANVSVEGSLDVSGRFSNDTGRFGTDAQGPAFINGGSISITTNKTSDDVVGGRDLTGSILLAGGSVLDVSSGGYISPLGKPKTASPGVMAGKGGSISLVLYQGRTWSLNKLTDPTNPAIPSPTSSQAVLQLDGTVLAYGFETNGSLRLGVADTLRIGGTPQPGEISTFRSGQGSTVPVALLTGGGFGSYTFESVGDGYSNSASINTNGNASITVSAGVNLNLQQSNFSSTLNYGAAPTGTKLGAEAQQAPATKLALLPDDQRKPVNLTLKADTILLDSGSSIVTDPRATITLGGSPAIAPSDPLLRDKPATSVLLRGNIVDHGGTLAINALNTWFDSWTAQQARIDLSGMFIANSLFGQPSGPTISGTVVSGGMLSIEAGTLTSAGSGNTITYYYDRPFGGYVVAESGQVDVSGYAGVVQIAAGRGRSSTAVWSDAGTVSVDVVGLAWGGSFAATGGRLSDGTAMLAADGKTSVANNGTIILGGGQVALQQDNTAIIAALATFHQSNHTIGPGSFFVSADQLAPFDNVFLFSGSAPGGAGRIFTDLPGNTANLGSPILRPLTIANSLNWHVANRLHVAASSITTSQDGSSVSLDAPYVLLTGGGDTVNSGTSTMTVTAQTIDVEGAAFSGFGQVQLKSSGDIRLSTPKVANAIDGKTLLVKPSSFTGTLATYADLVLSAQRIYPVSAVDFTIKSTAGNVAFQAPAGSSTDIPLSAGGSLTVMAANIDQGGNLFAPLGKIKLVGGVGTNPDGTSQGVVLEPGSLTSVTLADTVVPYGATSDGTGWYYNASSSPLSQPPAKGLELGGASVVTKAGSTIDVRGGGDLQAMEWIQGKGGSHDTLTSINGGLGTGSGAGPTVYALVPTTNDPVAAFDINFTAASGVNAAGQSGTKFTLPSGQVLYLQSGDAYPLAGNQITINGGAGIPAGSYTLYPAHYATLPGALRVVYYGDNLGRNVPSGTTLPDGTVLVTGNYTQSTVPGKQSSGQGLFAVQTGSVWQQYSEYSFSSANVFFLQKATHDHSNVPLLPVDGGRLAVTAQQQILLAATAFSQPAPGGRGSELDIAGNKLAVVSHQQYADSQNPGNVPAGYIPLDVSQLDSLGFESVLIGGTRSNVDPTKGTLITPAASNVVVDTRGDAFAVPEILLVAQAASPAGDGSVIIRAGSIIETVGTVHAGSGRKFQFATPVLGALFAASNDPGLALSGPTGVPSPVGDAGRVTIDAGARISTNTLTLQATASTNAIAINATDLHAKRLNLIAQTFAVGSTSASAVGTSVQLSNGQFGDVQGLALKSLSGAITVYGTFDPGPAVTSLTMDGPAVALAAGSGDGSVTVENGAITLINSTGLALPAGLPFSGANTNLTFEATDIVLGGGTQTIAGASAVSLSATHRVLVAGSGKLTLGTGSDHVNLTVTTPTVLVAGATSAGSSSFTLTTQGDVTLADIVARTGIASRPTDSSEIGGNFAVIAKTITVGNTIQAQAGTLTLEATGADVVNPDGSVSPALSLTDGAYLAAGGYIKTLADVTTFVAGGRVLLQSDLAAVGATIRTSATSVIDVAQPADGLGYGGQIQISATAGHAVLLGDLRGRGGNGLGGSFKVDTNFLEVDSNGFDPNVSWSNVKLDVLADKLLAGGLSGAIDIHTRTGNLILSAGHTLKANAVTLTADSGFWDVTNPANQLGQITIAGTIDASGYAGTTADGTGQAGGQVGLYGANQVTLTSTSIINASTTHSDERGGDVTIGIPWAAKGKIRLQAGMQIDVSGGTKGGLSNGTVTFRAPVDGHGNAKIVELDAAGNEMLITDKNTGVVHSTFDSNINIKGARSVIVEPFVAFDTIANSPYGLDGSKLGWDGQVDPAGLYDANGNKVLFGSWTGVSGIQFSFTVNNGTGGSGYQTPPIPLIQGANVSAIAVMGLDGVTTLTLTTTGPNPQPLTLAPNLTGLKVTFDKPTNTGMNVTNRAAQGVATTDANGVVTIMITDAGSGYTGLSFGAHITTPQGTTTDAVVATGGLKVVDIAAQNNNTSFVTSTPTILFIFGKPTHPASAGFVQTSSLTGTTTASGFQLNQPDAFAAAIPDPTAPTGNENFQGAGPHAPFFNSTLVAFSQGTWTYKDPNKPNSVLQDYGFQNLIDALNPLGQNLGANVVHVRPGIELVNSDPNTNSGNITVKTAWNLAAGSAYNLQPNQQNGNKYVQVYDSTSSAQQSYVTFDYRYVANYGTGLGTAIEPGALTLRAVNNVVIGASISDGFFQFRNYLDSAYATAVATYLTNNNTVRGIDPITQTTFQYYLNGSSPSPIAPYLPSANIISPSAQDIAAADLFPNQLNVCIASCGTANSVGVIPQGAKILTVTDPGSWTYRITAGADLKSGNPNAVKPLGSTIYNPTYAQVYNLNSPSQTPSVIMTGQITGQASYQQLVSEGTNNSVVPVNLPTMVRTGTGSINVTAAYNVFLNDPDPKSPTANPAAPGVIYAAGVNTPRLADPNYQLQTVNGISTVVAMADPKVFDPNQLFFEPQLLGYGEPLATPTNISQIYGPPTAAAFPHMGGDVRVAAQSDIVGYSPATSTTGKTSYQYYKQWLLADAGLTPADASAAASISVRGAGVFAPIGTSIASQTAWWIQYGSFQQGILSAGGNVTATAGRDVIDLSVSLPTTGRVSGGISATSTPVTHVYDSGNMTVSAGRDILGGAFYEGSGHASIVAGRSVGQTTEKLSWQGLDIHPQSVTPALPLDNVPLLAVDLGRIQLTAGGSISIAGVVNPAALHLQDGSNANPAGNRSTPIYMDTYGPQSGVGLLSVTGNLTIAITPTAINSASSSVYPASFDAVALGGDITTTGLTTGLAPTLGISASQMPGMILSGSEHGDFQLVAEGSIDLTFGSNPASILKPYICAGPALLDKAFDPFRPDAWFGTHSGDTSYAGPSSVAVLSHQNDSTIARIVAATGNIVGSGSTNVDLTGTIVTGLPRIEINRPTEVYAGGNITDLNLIVQNIQPSDVSSVITGGNITYTGLNIAGGLQVAGPGFFVVQAGGDLGPFLPVSHDNTAEVKLQQGIASVGNASMVPVGNTFIAGGPTGIYNTALLGPYINPNTATSNVSARRNALLNLKGADGTTSGADVIALFGVAKGIDYKAVVDAYIDPGNSANVPHNYFSELLAFLTRVKIAAGPDPLATFKSLPQSLQHVFVDQVFFAELKAVGLSDQGKAATPRGYQVIATMFPASYGYTANDGSSPVKTGDLNLLHSTIQTRQGGDISIFGPGGNILVGPLATEPNTNLKLSDLGILTLGSGAINTFTDQSVRVDSSRVLTTQGGDILMWSSNGDLDAGRGSKTTLSLPPLQVLFDGNDYQSVDLGGFVTGAGIGTVKASSFAKSSNLYLLAPRGIVDFGVAGSRSSGNLVVVAPVVANAGNITVQGTTTGVPVITVPNAAGLTTTGNSAAAATKSSDAPTAGGNQDRASVFIVEVIGYGGGDGSAPAGDGDTQKNGDDQKNSDEKKKGG